FLYPDQGREAELHGRNGHPPETIPPPVPVYRPFAYPAWPTSQAGPQITLPPPGQYPQPRRTDQMVYSSYDQERGMPGVLPTIRVVLQEKSLRTYRPEAELQKANSEAETI